MSGTYGRVATKLGIPKQQRSLRIPFENPYTSITGGVSYQINVEALMLVVGIHQLGQLFVRLQTNILKAAIACLERYYQGTGSGSTAKSSKECKALVLALR